MHNPIATAAELCFLCISWKCELQLWLPRRCLWEHAHLDSKMTGSPHAVRLWQAISFSQLLSCKSEIPVLTR